MRALWLSYPHDPQAARLGDEYLWGGDLLIAPVVEKAAKSRRLYLPEGAWYDWWTGERFDGKRWIDRPVNLGILPIYARAGSIIPLDPVRQYTGQPVAGATTLRVYPGIDGEFTVYDDDGQSLNYHDDSDVQTVWIHIRWNESAHELNVEPDSRMKHWPGGARKYEVELVGSGLKPREIEFRGVPVGLDL
jgi:alpha-glucosidase (family GH31 glycosyl hydrolase)